MGGEHCRDQERCAKARSVPEHGSIEESREKPKGNRERGQRGQGRPSWVTSASMCSIPQAKGSHTDVQDGRGA